MAIFTAAELSEQIAAWKAALLALAASQEYTIAGRRLRRADLPEVRATLAFLEGQRSDLAGGCRRVYTKPAGDSW
jgi:hypothetical protein